MPHRDDIGTPRTEPSGSLTSALQEQVLILEAQLRDAETRSVQARQLFTQAPNIAFLLSPEGRVLDANSRACALLNTSPERLVGRRLGQCLAPVSQAAFAALLRRVFDEPGHYRAEVRLLLGDGTLREMAVEVAPADGQVRGPACHLTLTDISSWKEAHSTLLDTQVLLECQAQDLHARIRVLSDEVVMVMEATSTELHKHLARAQGLVNVHRLEASDIAESRHLKAMEQSLQQVTQTLNSLEQYTQAIKMRMRLQPVDLNRVLDQVRKDLREQTKGRDVQITAADLPVVQGDSQALQMIVREYLSNALKFTRTREVARLHIRVEETTTAYFIGVQDNGVGFNMRQRDRIFRLFQRLHSGTVYEGSGLGLAVVQRLCERFGGRAWAEGKPDQGATFWFACPKEPVLTV